MNKKGKKSNGDGSIRQRDNKRWELRVSIGRDPTTGKLKSKSYSFSTEKEARNKLREIQQNLDNGMTLDDNITVGKWLNQWLGVYGENTRPHTQRSYESDIRIYFIPEFGNIHIKQLRQIQIQNAVNKWSRGSGRKRRLAPKTVRDIHGTLHAALEAAKQEGIIQKNPADNIKLPVVSNRQIHALTPDEIAKLLEGLKGDLYENVIHVDIMTGMRESEILGLTWDCIDFEKKEITVKQQLMKNQTNSQYYLDPHTKTNMTRTIAVSNSVMEIMTDIRAKQSEKREKFMQSGIWNEDIPNLVFTNETGGHLTQASALKHLQRVSTRLGLGRVKFHELRHTYASLSIAIIGTDGEGGSIKAVQESLGHSSAELTLNTYAHGTDFSKRLGAEKLDKLLTDAMTSKGTKNDND